MAHRLAYEFTHGPIPEGQEIRHQCHNRVCCNPEHMLLGSHAENVQDMVRADRHPRGESMGQSKLTDEGVRLLRREVPLGTSIRSMATLLGVSSVTALKAYRRETWKHVA